MRILGLGLPELLVILIVVLLIFGPKTLPKLGSSFGKAIKGMRAGMGEVNKKVDEAFAEDEDEDAADKSEARLPALEEGAPAVGGEFEAAGESSFETEAEPKSEQA